jgi:hypothetical protein
MANGFDKMIQKMFVSNEAIASVIKNLKDLKVYLTEMKTKIDNNNLVELCQFLEENCIKIGLPSMQMSKKLEKNFYHG